MSPSDPAKPPSQYIYKIAPSTPQPLSPCPRPDLNTNSNSTSSAEPILPVSALDRSSGYIHMSTAAQISGTLRLFFPTEVDKRDVVWLLKVWVGAFENGRDVLRWESPDGTVTGSREGEGLFPHLYVDASIDAGEGEEGGRRLWLRRDEVVEVREVVCGVGSVGWEGALEELVGEGWLV